MEIKDVKLNLKVKSNKVTKILHLLFKDAVAEFQNDHPKTVPSIFAALNKGDTELAIEKIEYFLESLKSLNDSVLDIRGHILKSMPEVSKSNLENVASTFIDPDGNVIHKMKPGERAIIAGPPEDKKPIKKRATKKKAKKEEE